MSALLRAALIYLGDAGGALAAALAMRGSSGGGAGAGARASTTACPRAAVSPATTARPTLLGARGAPALAQQPVGFHRSTTALPSTPPSTISAALLTAKRHLHGDGGGAGGAQRPKSGEAGEEPGAPSPLTDDGRRAEPAEPRPHPQPEPRPHPNPDQRAVAGSDQRANEGSPEGPWAAGQWQ